MEWLTRWWRELLRDVALTGSGLAVIGTQVAVSFLGGQVNPYLIGAGLSLTFPSTYVRLREIMSVPRGTDGHSGPPLLPPGPEPSTLPSAGTGE